MPRVAQNRTRILQDLRSAIQFLTIFPCPSGPAFNARAALPYFPICGLLIGTALVVIDAMAALIWPRLVVAMVDVIALAVISGALHLDGLADTADGLYGRREPDQALSIMKDSRIGAMGMIAVLCCIGLKWVGLAHMGSRYKIWLLIVPAYARASVLFGTKLLPYGRPGGGTGHAFFEPPLQVKDFWALGLVAALSILTSWHGIAINVCFLVIVWAVIGWYRYKIHCITGDMLGALIEIMETALFLLAASHWNP